MITVMDLAKRYGTQVLFEDVSFRLDPGKRYGIVGANGAGKSTLLRILTGEEYSDGGEINIPTRMKLGTLNQDHFAFEGNKIMDVVIKGKPALADAWDEQAILFEDENSDPERIAQLEEVIADNDGYVAESRIGEMLEGLGIPVEKHHQNMSVLSGGYKLRVLLAQCLFGDPDVLLLDEPTNHLDIYSIKWLEDYLRRCRGIVVVVSHDREFLNNVCTHVIDIDYGTAKIYTGNYDQFLDAKALDEEMRRQEAEKAEKKMDELNQFITRFKAKASKARQAQSKQKQIERMEKDLKDPVYSSRVFPRIRFTSIRPPGKQVLEVSNVSKSYGEHKVLNDVSFTVWRDDKIAILGPNGVGKSTLLKIIMGELAPDQGESAWGHETYPQYFSQDHHELMPGNTTPNDWLHSFAPAESIGVIRGTLGNLLFSGDDVHKSTSALSGGEAARLVIARMILLKGNILILDEPTNHLDMESIESLVQALQDFEGTILLVSHNRYVVERVATKVLEISPDGIDLFDGDYDEYMEKVGTDHLSYQVDIRAEKTEKKSKKEEYRKEKQQKKKTVNKQAFKKEAKDLLDQSKTFESDIEKLEQELQEINDLFFDPTYFGKAKPEEIREKNDRKRTLETALEEKYAAWEDVNLKIEELKEKHGID